MRIAIAQMATRAGDFEETARRMVDYSRRAADAGVELLVFPAAALCGVAPVQRADREGFLLDLMECLLTLVDELACPCLLPMLVDTDEAPLPEALLIDAGEIRPVRLRGRGEGMAAHMGNGHGEKEQSGDEDNGQRLLPAIPHPKANGKGEEGIQSHAGGLCKGHIGEQGGQCSADCRRDTGSEHYRIKVHSRL